MGLCRVGACSLRSTHLLKTSSFCKLQRYGSVTLHLSPKNPISEGQRKNTSAKIQILPWQFFPQWFGHKTIESSCFWNDFMKNQLKLIFPKKCGFRCWKGSNIWRLFYLACRQAGPGQVQLALLALRQAGRTEHLPHLHARQMCRHGHNMLPFSFCCISVSLHWLTPKKL